MEVIDLEGKVCVVTGSSSGIGKGVATKLAGMGAVPVLISRDNERGRQTLTELQQINNRVEWIPTDLSSQRSVRNAADQFKARHNRCDYLFLCAGVPKMSREVTEENIEIMFATNYLGHFLLTNLLFDELRTAAPSRVIIVSGSSHKPSATEGVNECAIHFDDLQGEECFSFARQSKQVVLAKILFTYELARRWAKYDIAACTLSPGLVRSNLVSGLPLFVRCLFSLRCAIAKAQKPEEAAAHLLELATCEVNGKYYEAYKGGLDEARSSAESYDSDIAKRLWTTSEELVGQAFSD